MSVVRARYLTGDETRLGWCEIVSDVQIKIAALHNRFLPEVKVFTLACDELESPAPAPEGVIVILLDITKDDDFWHNALTSHASLDDIPGTSRALRTMRASCDNEVALTHAENVAASCLLQRLRGLPLSEQEASMDHRARTVYDIGDEEEAGLIKVAPEVDARSWSTRLTDVFIREGANVNFVDYDGWTLLLQASLGGYGEIVDLLTKAKAKVQHTDMYRWSALFAASFRNHAHIVNKLLVALSEQRNGGASRLPTNFHHDPDEIEASTTRAPRDSPCWTREYARAHNYDERPAVMCAADGDTRIEFLEAERQAAARRNLRAKSALSDSVGAPSAANIFPVMHVDSPTHDGRTPLLEVCIRGFTDVANLLIRAMADLNIRHYSRNTPLILAAKEGHRSVVEILVAARAELDHRDEDGKTALLVAVSRSMWGIAEVLRLAGAVHN